jgi:biopolymer transport protein ExbB
MSPFEMLREGGPVLWILIVCGVVAPVVFLERLLHLRRARIRYGDFLGGVFNILGSGKTDEALVLCEETPGPVAHLMRTAILHRDVPREALRDALESAGSAEISRLERRLAFMATIVQIAPLLGLLGSFLGVLETVLVLRRQAPLVQAADVSGGLVRALVNAIAGLMVAIPAYAMFNLLVTRIDRIVLDMQQAASEITAFMGRRAGGGAAGN